MSLINLTEVELQNLLMEETKKLTTALREGIPADEKEKIKAKIEEIIRTLEEKKSKNGPRNSLTNH